MLRQPILIPTKEGDIYGTGIIMQEIVTRGLPFEVERQRMDVKGKERATFILYCYILVLCLKTSNRAVHESPLCVFVKLRGF